MEEIDIFIDAEYLIQSLRCLNGRRRALKKEDFVWHNFVKFIANGRKIGRIFYYTARLDESENKATFDAQTLFLEQIKNQLSDYDFKLRLGKMIKIRNKTQRTWREQQNVGHQQFSWGQKGIDTKIILDMCAFAYENAGNPEKTAVLVSGDEDFSDVLSLCREKGVRAELIMFDRFGSMPSEELKASAVSHTTLSFYDLERRNLIRNF